MKRVETTEDRSRGTFTYQLDDNRYVTLDANAVALHGAENLVQWLGARMDPCDAERTPRWYAAHRR